MQKNFDDFKAELLTNEARLQQMNETASKLMSSGHTEAALKIQTQIEVSTYLSFVFAIELTNYCFMF